MAEDLRITIKLTLLLMLIVSKKCKPLYVNAYCLVTYMLTANF